MPAETPPLAGPALSIIVPLAPQEEAWRALLPRLKCAAADEIILAAAAPPPPRWAQLREELSEDISGAALQWLQYDTAGGGDSGGGKNGRAAAMNAAAAAAAHAFLWFVHADSRPAAAGICRLRRALQKKPAALHYFQLRFYDGGWKMRVNELGARLRCRLFSNPFGDQALCLSAALFATLGGYDETAPCGEDHLLVLAAARRGVKILPVPAAVATSARRYLSHGWWRTVVLYQKIWWRQWRQ